MRIAVSTLLVCVSTLHAQPTQGQESPSSLLRVERMFDSETGDLVGPVDIRVADGMIREIAQGLEALPEETVIDLSGLAVLPGLIDAHIHLLYLEDPTSGDLTSEGLKSLLLEGTPLRALHGAARGRTFLDAGITTVRDLGNSGLFGDVALKRAVQDGSHEGPRMFVSGPGLSPVGGQLTGVLPEHQLLASEEYRIVSGADDARAAVREAVTFGADVIKVYSDNAPNPSYLSGAEMAAIVEEAGRMGVRVAAHATHDESIWSAVQAGVHSIEHGYQVADSTLRLMAERGVALVPTDPDSLSLVHYLERAQIAVAPDAIAGILRESRERLLRAVELGVTIAAGSDMYVDMGVPQGVAARRVLNAYHEAGMDPADILRAATWNNAELLGQSGRIGVLRVDALADMIGVDGNPLEDFDAIERVRFVMVRGRVHFAPSR